ncbi:hypothetical protein H6G33_37230 [Calothrix sp. FACHB-1219]|uniref:hypothetical protein n=1 Tax=unclassified Calothrix TaxID=2619626 RepID=UPI001685B627|nr:MULTISPECIES: hypothetical protein [unclassified Calothrix]MBD2208001.1 hypothetical protein [Calothrix sp. FACHB-168]MBD2222572.1 hypothetical protein [Calothrix sp. FACHB-1219]
MTEYSSIISLLETERERYIIEAAELERRLKFIHNQISAIEALISGYATEEQMYSSSRRLSNFNSTRAFLQDSETDIDESDKADDYTMQETLIEENAPKNHQAITEISSPTTNLPSPISKNESEDSSAHEVDISDIPKITTKRNPSTVPMLDEFLEYSVQNAILILMRRRPDLHMHIDAIIRDLYGDLPPEKLKKAKSSVTSALSAGSIQGLWYRVLRTNGVYTLHYEKGVTAKPQQRK